MYKNIFDTHTHYDDEQFDKDRNSLISSLEDKGVIGVVSCGVDIETSKANKKLSDEYGFVYFAAGFHPENLEGFELSDLEEIEALAKNEKCVAIGEIGLDYHWMSSTKEKQKEFFISQIELAKKLDMPVIIHDREAHGDTLQIIKDTEPKGVLHCFSGSVEMARDVIKLGMYIGLNGGCQENTD